MRDCDYDKPIHPLEYPTGCFMFFRTVPLKAIGGFDQDFFLHYEDADIGRRMLKVARVFYVPSVRVTHRWARDTHRTLRAMLITARSGWLYWRKWGGVWSSKSTDELSEVSRTGETRAPTLACRGIGRTRQARVGAFWLPAPTGSSGRRFVPNCLDEAMTRSGWSAAIRARRSPGMFTKSATLTKTPIGPRL